MTQGYRPGGACRSCGTIPRKSSRGPGPFLVVSHYTIWTTVSLYYLDHSHNPSNTSCDLCPPIELGAGRLPYRRVCICVAHGVCVCVFFPSILDIKFVGRTSRGHTGFLIHLPSAVRALIFVARRIQPFLSLVDREVEFCVLTN